MVRTTFDEHKVNQLGQTVFGDRYDVGASDFSNEDLLLVGSSQINVIRSFSD